MLRAQLDGSGWAIREADSGLAALAAIQAPRPTAIVLDLSMPDIDGLEVLRRLRERPGMRDVNIVIHTSRAIGAAERSACQRHRAFLLDKASTSRSSLLSVLATATGGGPVAGEDRILLADDDDVGRYVVATMLRRAGFTVDEVPDGAPPWRRRADRPTWPSSTSRCRR